MSTNQIREVDHVGVMVADLEAAGRFLSDTFGLALEREADVAALDVKARFYRCGPVMIEIFQPNDPAVAQRALGGAPALVEHIAILGEGLTWHQPAGAAVVLLGVAVSQGRLAGLRGAPETVAP